MNRVRWISFLWLGLVLIASGPALAQVADPASDSCRPREPSLDRVLEISDRVIVAEVTRVTPEARHGSSADGVKLLRGTVAFTPIEALKGALPEEPYEMTYDATVYPDLFGPPCRYMALPVIGERWLFVASRDGLDGEGDGRLDRRHKIYWLAPLVSFDR